MTSQGSSAHILIIDDHMPTRLIATKSLQLDGFSVTGLEDAHQAIEKFHDIKPDIILLDVMMPIMNGFEACQKLRDIPEAKDIPIIMMTGLDDIEAIDQAYNVGATDFVTKPINWQILRHRLRYMLRAKTAMVNLNDTLKQVKYMAYYDSLTGLPNREYFKQQISVSLTKLAKNEKAAILFLDLDRFKRINDTLGHSAGDTLLKEAAQRLKKSLRREDVIAHQSSDSLIARFGGDEFTIMLGKLHKPTNAANIARRILNAFSSPLLINKKQIYITTSIGISIYPDDGTDAETLLKNADTAMYHSKDFGRNNYHYYNEQMNSQALERLSLETHLRKAVEQREFVPYFQPKYNAAGTRLIGTEVLLRWNHPELGTVSPAEFIPMAEELGLIIPMTEWLFECIGQIMQNWRRKNYPDIEVAINIAADHFRQPNFAEKISEMLDVYQIPADKIELEITENAIMKDLDMTNLTMSKLKMMNIKLAIDDFGTGYSSLAYLKRFAIHRLKIDRSFVKDLLVDQEDAAITRTIIAIAKNLNLQTTAEGVETVEQLECLRNLGCNEMQGYLFSPPVPVEEFEEILSYNRHQRSEAS